MWEAQNGTDFKTENFDPNLELTRFYIEENYEIEGGKITDREVANKIKAAVNAHVQDTSGSMTMLDYLNTVVNVTNVVN